MVRTAQLRRLGWPSPGHGAQDQHDPRVGGGADLVALVRVEMREEARPAGFDSPVVLDLDLARRHDEVRPLVHLVLLEQLAGGEVDGDHARLVVRPQHLGVVRFYVQRCHVPALHGSKPYLPDAPYSAALVRFFAPTIVLLLAVPAAAAGAVPRAATLGAGLGAARRAGSAGRDPAARPPRGPAGGDRPGGTAGRAGAGQAGGDMAADSRPERVRSERPPRPLSRAGQGLPAEIQGPEDPARLALAAALRVGQEGRHRVPQRPPHRPRRGRLHAVHARGARPEAGPDQHSWWCGSTTARTPGCARAGGTGAASCAPCG